MANLAPCYSKRAIAVSDSYRFRNSGKGNVRSTFIPSIQDEVSSLYKVKLSTQKHNFLIKLTWSSHNIDYYFTITFIEDPNCKPSKSFLIRNIKGSKKVQTFPSKIELIWNISNATYEMGPKPVNGWYVAILINSELVLIGEIKDDPCLNKLVLGYPFAKSSLLSQNERILCNDQFSTKAMFSDKGKWHDIAISFKLDEDEPKFLSMYVCIDRKNVIQVKRLEWNFRGNQILFFDGMLVDMMWDVHDWFFDSNLKSESRLKSKVGIFLFRPRSGLDSRLWLEEKNLDVNEQECVTASLLIYACKNLIN